MSVQQDIDSLLGKKKTTLTIEQITLSAKTRPRRVVERNKSRALWVWYRLERCEQEVTLGALGGLWLGVTRVQYWGAGRWAWTLVLCGIRAHVGGNWDGEVCTALSMLPWAWAKWHTTFNYQRDCCSTMSSYPHLCPSSSLPVAEHRMVTMNSIRWVSRIVCFPSKEQHLLFLALLGIMSVLNQTNSTLRLFEVLILHISEGCLFVSLVFCVLGLVFFKFF